MNSTIAANISYIDGKKFLKIIRYGHDWRLGLTGPHGGLEARAALKRMSNNDRQHAIANALQQANMNYQVPKYGRVMVTLHSPSVVGNDLVAEFAEWRYVS